MSQKDDKQVQDALLAIKKLVEMSGDQMGASDDVLTLDNVVWRNPVKEEAEEAPHTEQDVMEEASIEAPLATEETPQRAPVAQASLSVSSRDLDVPQKKEAVAPPVTSPLALEEKAYELAAQHEPSPQVQATPQIIQPEIAQPEIAQPEIAQPDIAQPDITPLGITPPETTAEVTELTSPLGRRGGGFYSAMTQKPAIKTLSDEITAEPQPKEPAVQEASKPSVKSEPAPASHEPALTDFHGADFNFSAAEGLMTAASFSDLNQPVKPITAEVQVPVAEPAVTDPVGEVQAMFQTPEQEASEQEEAYFSYSAHPNLHVVSDQTQETDDEEEGFSGAVRLALRSIIKEQVSTWLQGNMTCLIEEALTTPQKGPSSLSKPSSKKR